MKNNESGEIIPSFVVRQRRRERRTITPQQSDSVPLERFISERPRIRWNGGKPEPKE